MATTFNRPTDDVGHRWTMTRLLRFGLVALFLATESASLSAAPQEEDSPSLQRLPEVAAATDAELASDQALMSFAGDTVRLALPAEWQVAEVPAGRELRLVLTPGGIPQQTNVLADGVWIGCQYQPQDEEEPAGRLAALLLQRLAIAQREAKPTGPIQSRPLGSYRALQQEFVTANGSRGHHGMIRLPNALVQWHWISPASTYVARRPQVEGMLASLVLQNPTLRQPSLPGHVATAAPLLGYWKAIQSRLTLAVDGSVLIEYDAGQYFPLDSQGFRDYRRVVKRLSGIYQVEGDLLRITWNDESQLNYRWQIRNGELFLTDHFGRVSQLKRLLR